MNTGCRPCNFIWVTVSGRCIIRS